MEIAMNRTGHCITSNSVLRRLPLASLLGIALSLLSGAPCANATAIANSSLQLETLAITSSSGSILFAPTAQSFAQAQNSLGELVSNFDSGTTAASSAVVTWADASGSADSILQTASAIADVNIPSGMAGAASSVGQGSLFDFSFMVTGTTGPVAVQFAAMLPAVQSLMTDEFGMQATSELVFDLSIDGMPVLFQDSPLSIGPSSSLSNSGTWNLNNSVTLNAGQAYTLVLQLDAESSGINTIPEPATFSLIAGGALLSMVRRLRPPQS
jgi:hypothetical protein